MKPAIRLLAVCLLAAAFGFTAYAADVEGILIDRMCSTKIVQNKDQKAAEAHTRMCNLMDDCAKSGYGVFTSDNRFIILDEAGNKKAVEALKASTQRNNIRVRVSGEQSGDKIKATAVKIL